MSLPSFEDEGLGGCEPELDEDSVYDDENEDNDENGRACPAESRLMHRFWTELLGGQLALCPKKSGAKRVLDIGTGYGLWAIDYGALILRVTGLRN
ncbi:methyltransferase domain-containing protein [Colletotrichum tofieldiae]|nr:methyltransferase domain-containing protein [Colletotrichum tofieldiae]GKT68897.1 methyltransferase domain-containing protein [Colletotrichum tofieldiae]